MTTEARGGAFLDIPRRWEAAGGHQILRIHSRAGNRTINAPGTTRAKTNAKNQPETVCKFEVIEAYRITQAFDPTSERSRLLKHTLRHRLDPRLWGGRS